MHLLNIINLLSMQQPIQIFDGNTLVNVCVDLLVFMRIAGT